MTKSNRETIIENLFRFGYSENEIVRMFSLYDFDHINRVTNFFVKKYRMPTLEYFYKALNWVKDEDKIKTIEQVIKNN